MLWSTSHRHRQRFFSSRNQRSSKQGVTQNGPSIAQNGIVSARPPLYNLCATIPDQPFTKEATMPAATASAPDPKKKFTFGLCTVGNVGRDTFGEPTREKLGLRQILDLL